MRFSSFFLSIFLLILVSNTIAQKETSPFLSKHISNYTDNEYGKSFNAENWSITQDNDGMMYFGNSNYVLTFDGMHWNSIPVSEKSGYVVSLLATSNGNIYWGYNGDFGVIETTKSGKQISRSFLKKIPEIDRYFSRVWRSFEYNNEIVFFSQESIFIYNASSDSIRIIYPEESFHLAFVTDNELYVRDRAYGLMKFDGESFNKVAGGDVFHNEGIFGMISISEDRILIITQLIGLYYYNPLSTEPSITKLNSIDSDILNTQQIIGAKKLKGGNIALNTASNGVIIINKKGEIIHKINLASGIADNDVKQIYQDLYGNMWIATNNGISLVNYSSPISLFLHNDKSGLYGSIKALAMINNQLYVGTTTGLFTYSQKANQVFEPINGLTNNITALCAVEDRLFVGTSDAVYLLNNNQLRKIASTDATAILYSKNNNRLYVIGNNGLLVFNKNINCEIEKSLLDIKIKAIGAFIFQGKNNSDELWLGTMSDGLWKINLSNNLNIEVEKFTDMDGIGDGWVKPLLINNEIFAANISGLHRFINRQEIKSKLSDSIDISNIKEFFVPAEIPYISKGTISNLVQYENNYWLVYNGSVGQFRNQEELYKTPFESLKVGKINSMLAQNSEIIWIGANGGLAKVDLSIKKDYYKKPDISIRSLKFSNDSILFNKVIGTQEYIINYKQNSFSISYSSLYNENGVLPLFSYKLNNYDDEWSIWGTDINANYKKIAAGKYTFKVKAKNVYNVESEIASISIKIAAPWYQRWWAILIYIFIFLILIVVIVKAYTYRLKQKNIHLEKIISQRTQEIREQKDEIEKQRDLIEEVHQEIQSSIEYAKRIQTAVLPQHEFTNGIIKDYFILFKPKDVVSGDFYWAKQSGNHLIIAVADCTGHGVPGAFMSMLGISLLNEIVGKEKVIEAGEILNELREGVIRSLKQKESSNESLSVMDGMDISLVSIDLKTGELQWAGAHNPLFIISDSKPALSEKTNIKIHKVENIEHQLYDIKADKMPIAISGKMTPFTNHRIKLKTGDTIFMFSDGFIDQFGGPKGKKFMIKAFRNMLLVNSELPLIKQLQNYENQLNKWVEHIDIDNQLPFTQIDDICLMGIRF